MELVNEDALRSVVVGIVKEELKKQTNYEKRTKPYKTSEFAKLMNVSTTTIRRKIEANLIATNRLGLIPASEYERLVNAE